MLKKSLIIFSTALTLSGTIATTGNILLNDTKVYASETDTEVETPLDEHSYTSKDDFSLLNGYTNPLNYNVSETELNGEKTIKYTNDNDELKALEIKSSEGTTSILHTENEVTVTVTKLNPDGEYTVTTKSNPLVPLGENSEEADISPNSQSSGMSTMRAANTSIYPKTFRKGMNPTKHGFTYTKIAIGAQALEWAVDGAIGAKWLTLVAATFGIKEAAASLMMSYFGIKIGTPGKALAKFLDVSGNGWIGLYKKSTTFAGYPLIFATY